ncbi:hypothetical protein ACA910_002603 [Epithemia clementina (nom. ined.)]
MSYSSRKSQPQKKKRRQQQSCIADSISSSSEASSSSSSDEDDGILLKSSFSTLRRSANSTAATARRTTQQAVLHETQPRSQQKMPSSLAPRVSCSPVMNAKIQQQQHQNKSDDESIASDATEVLMKRLLTRQSKTAIVASTSGSQVGAEVDKNAVQPLLSHVAETRQQSVTNHQLKSSNGPQSQYNQRSDTNTNSSAYELPNEVEYTHSSTDMVDLSLEKEQRWEVSIGRKNNLSFQYEDEETVNLSPGQENTDDEHDGDDQSSVDTETLMRRLKNGRDVFTQNDDDPPIDQEFSPQVMSQHIGVQEVCQSELQTERHLTRPASPIATAAALGTVEEYTLPEIPDESSLSSEDDDGADNEETTVSNQISEPQEQIARDSNVPLPECQVPVSSQKLMPQNRYPQYSNGTFRYQPLPRSTNNTTQTATQYNTVEPGHRTSFATKPAGENALGHGPHFQSPHGRDSHQKDGSRISGVEQKLSYVYKRTSAEQPHQHNETLSGQLPNETGNNLEDAWVSDEQLGAAAFLGTEIRGNSEPTVDLTSVGSDPNQEEQPAGSIVREGLRYPAEKLEVSRIRGSLEWHRAQIFGEQDEIDEELSDEGDLDGVAFGFPSGTKRKQERFMKGPSLQIENPRLDHLGRSRTGLDTVKHVDCEAAERDNDPASAFVSRTMQAQRSSLMKRQPSTSARPQSLPLPDQWASNNNNKRRKLRNPVSCNTAFVAAAVVRKGGDVPVCPIPHEPVSTRPASLPNRWTAPQALLNVTRGLPTERNDLRGGSGVGAGQYQLVNAYNDEEEKVWDNTPVRTSSRGRGRRRRGGGGRGRGRRGRSSSGRSSAGGRGRGGAESAWSDYGPTSRWTSQSTTDGSMLGHVGGAEISF